MSRGVRPRSWCVRIGSIIAALTAAVAGLSVAASPASAVPPLNRYASPTGSGTDCSISSPCTLTQALATPVGEIVGVYLAPGTYTPANGTSFVISSSDVIAPTTPGSAVILQGNGATVISVPDSRSGPDISDVTIEDGDGDTHGGGIDNAGSMYLQHVTITGNVATEGGGILNFGTMTIVDSTISGNTATEGGGGIANSGTLTMEASTVTGNTGGGLFSPNDDSTLAADIIAGQLSGVDCSGGKDAVFSDAGYNIDDDGSCGLDATNNSVSDSSVIDDYLGSLGDHGGPTQTVPLLITASPATTTADPAFAVIPATFGLPAATLDGSSLACSEPDQRGVTRKQLCDIGAYELTPTLYASDDGTGAACTSGAPCALTEALSIAPDGGTVDLAAGTYQPASDASFTISSSITLQPTTPGSSVILDGNNATVLQVNDHAGSVTISGLTIEGGNGGTQGGGIRNSGSTYLQGVTITGNVAGDGGGIISFGTMTIVDSTISGNTASVAGGIFSGGTLTMEDSTVTGNSGGGVHAVEESTLALAADVIAGQLSGADCSGGNSTVFSDDGYNIDDDGSCGLSSTNHSVSDSAAIDNYLGALGSNGGPTQTVPLLVVPSPATTTADPALAVIPATFALPVTVAGVSLACSEPDQRGVTRAQPCDVGAFELSTTLYASVDGSGAACTSGAPCTLPEALYIAPDGATVNMAAGTYQPASDASFRISSSITLQPTTADTTVILQGNGATVINVPDTGSRPVISDVTIEGGNGGPDVGGINNYGSTYLQGVTITGNVGGQGGGIFNLGTMTIDNSTISGNRIPGDSDSFGGGITNAYGRTMTIDNSTISDNIADEFGGGVYNTGTMNIQHSTISGNQAAGSGGGVYNFGTLTVADSTISGNSSSGVGGGINNRAGLATIEDSTISGNSGGTAGGIFVQTDTVTLAADVIAKQNGGVDCAVGSGSFSDGGYNIDDDGTCGLSVTNNSGSDSAVIDNYLGALGSNGGPTQTVPLLAVPSPLTTTADPAQGAIPSGFELPVAVGGLTAACAIPDQRGTPRGDPCDIGAFALGLYALTFDANGGSGTMAPQAAAGPTALTANAFTRAGYAFAGWNTAADGSGTTYANEATYPFGSSGTLYAQWTPNVPPVVVSLTPVADAYVSAAAPSTNYGTSTSLLSRGTPGGVALLRFVVPVTPAGETLTGAVLGVHTTGDPSAGSTDTHTVSIANNSWVESAVTWNTRPAVPGPVLGRITGATSPNTAYSSVLSLSAVSALAGSTASVAVTDAGTDGLYLWSANTANLALRPHLVLTYRPSGPDTSPPSAPGLQTPTVTGSTVSLSWTASTDNVGVTGYSVYRSAVSGFTPGPATLVGTTAGLAFTDSGVPNGTWYYLVTAHDATPNTSDPSGQETAIVDAPATTSITVTATADAYGNASAPTTNYGSSTSLLSRGTPGGVVFLRFVLPAAPAGKILTGVGLRIHTSTDPSAGSTDAHTVSLAADNWTESTLTWNHRPAITGPSVGTIVGTTTPNTSYTTTLTVSSLAGDLGTEITLTVASTGNDGLYFWSRNYGNASQRPQLVLTFAAPPPPV